MAETEQVIEEANDVDFNPFDTRPITNEQPAPKADAAVVEAKPTETKEEVAATEAKPAEAAKPIVSEPKEDAPKETKVEAAFANELSEKVFNLLKEGKEDEVLNYLQEKRTLSTLDKLPAEDQIKLNLQYQHPEFTAEEVQELFEETYQRPEKPEQDIDQTDEEYAAVLAKYEKKEKTFQNKLNREAKEARKVLSAKQSELVLPDIQPKAAPEPTQEDLKRQEELHKSYLQSIDKGLSEFSGFETVLKDGDVQIPIKFTVNDEDKAQLKEDLQNFNVQDYFRERWLNEDNSWNGKQYAEDVAWLKNKDKILQKVANEAGSQRLAKHIQEQKNIDFSGGRQQKFQPSVAEEEDKMADFFFGTR